MHSKEKKTEPDLSAIIEGLIKADVRFILVGGLTTVIQGAPLTTMGVDIVHQQNAKNISKLFNFLKSVKAIYQQSDNKIIEIQEQDLFGMDHSLLSTRLGVLNVLAFIEQNNKYEDLINDVIEIEFRGKIVHILDIEKIIELKETSNNLKDLQRLPILRETLRQLKNQ